MLDKLTPLPYSLDYNCPFPWPTEQESLIGADYPFAEDVEETLEEHVIQRYLETLWLPQSITSLHHFIKDLRRITDTDPQELLKPLLLSVDAIREKYHVQLPQVLQDEGGAGEIEETMMWFAYGNERYHQTAEDEEMEKMRKEWLTKMEYREMKIQILLCFHILVSQTQKKKAEESKPPAIISTPVKNQTQTKLRSSLSPTKPIFPPTESTSIEREKVKPGKKKSRIDFEERLELLMDRLSIAQLMASLQTSSQPSTSTTSQNDWMQIFCEDVVKPLFQEILPTFYDLLRSKVFPHSPFSEDSDTDIAAPPPVAVVSRTQKKFKAKERCPPSPLKLHEVTKSGSSTLITRTKSDYAIPAGSGSGSGSVRPQKDQVQKLPVFLSPTKRHRSRSVSLSVEEVRARGASRGGVASSKTLFRGEVEMKRSASKSAKSLQSSATVTKSRIEEKSQASKSKPTRPIRPLKETNSKTFVFSTPVKRLYPDLLAPASKPKNESDEFVAGDEFEWSSEEDQRARKRSKPNNYPASWIFVEDTPIKRKGE